MRPNGSILLEKEEELVQSHGMLLLFKIFDKDRNKAIDKKEFTWPTINLDNAFDILDFVFETGPLINLILPPITPNQNTGVKGYQNEIKEDELKYFGHEISSDEMKYETKLILPLIFNILDQNNDGFLSIDDVAQMIFDFEIQHDDMLTILSFVIDKFGDTDISDVMKNFDFDVNGDGIFNNFDIYVLEANHPGKENDTEVTLLINQVLNRISRALDQNQDGVYTSEEIDHFVKTMWTMWDLNQDSNISMDDWYLQLKHIFNVDGYNVSDLKGYLGTMKNYVNEEGSRLLKFAFPLVDKNGGGKIFMDEFLMNKEWIHDILFKVMGCRGENCFNPKPVPMPSENLNFGASEEIPCFFPQLSSVTIACEDRLRHLETAFVLACLDSPIFFNETGNIISRYITRIWHTYISIFSTFCIYIVI